MLLLRQCPEPILHILFGLVLGKAVAFLNLALELVLPPIDDVEVVVGEPTPLLLGSALELFPVPFDSIPVRRAIAPSTCAERRRNSKKAPELSAVFARPRGAALVSSRPRSSCRTAGPNSTTET